jgi:hypothetical protein
MAMNPKPPKPDALLTIVTQLEQLRIDWERAISKVSSAGSSGPGPFAQGQRDAWSQAQRQIGALIESIKVARASGIYLTDAQKELIALVEDRHKVTMGFLKSFQKILSGALLLTPVEDPSDEADQAG